MENTNVGVYADLVRFCMEKAMKEPWPTWGILDILLCMPWYMIRTHQILDCTDFYPCILNTPHTSQKKKTVRT